MQPAINQTSLDARDFIKKGAQELRDQIKEKKNLPISEKEKKLLLDNLKSENREANKSEEHKNAMKQLTSDVSIIRQFGETKKWKKLNKEEFTWVKEQFYGETSEEKSKETPLKILEKERKTAAIAELERLGMKTDERVAAINAIKFENDKILIGNTPWAYENMKWWKWTFKEKTTTW